MNLSVPGPFFSFLSKFRAVWVLLALILPLLNGRVFGVGATNTIVRFEFVRGTNELGRTDVELFDHEKPETVRNFLLYVRSGAYSNVFLHRLVPDFVIQGGGFSVTNPASADRFSTYQSVTNFGQVTNEFSVGQRMSNIFGTIAMAKLGNDANSASSQWFFNLGNNTTNLDNQNGGFTVFGRVLESQATNEGFNVLEHFNTLSTNAGVVNLNNLLGPNYQVFSTLPVSYTNSISRVPNYRELYFVRISILNNSKPAGAAAPSIALTSPAPNSAFTNETVRIRGSASDDAEVARVIYKLGEGTLQGAIGTTNWEVAIDSPLGFQTVTIQSVDWDGNFSAPISVNYFFRRTLELDLQVVGRGTVSGLTDGQPLSANTSYTATATPLAGSIFESWTGSITNSSATLTFTTPSTGTNFTLIAKFITDPTPALGGIYQGLFQPLGPTDFEGVGYMSLTNDSAGSFTGSLSYHGVLYYYTGKFDAAGNANISGNIGGVGRTISLTLQKLNANGLITGSFSGTASTTLIQLERLSSGLPANNAPTPGSYTFVIPMNVTNTPSSTTPGGHGFGTVNIAANGRLSVSGSLGDGTTINAGQSLTRLGRWPLYITLDAGRGVVFGWINHKTNEVPKLEGSLTWLRKANGAAKFYPGGVTNQVNFAASKYTPPDAGERVLNLVHGVVRLTGTDLPSNATNVVKLRSDNTFQVFEPNFGNLQLTLDTASGRVSGVFANPFFGTEHQINGAILTASNYIRGQFISGSEIGGFTLDLAPFLVPRPIESATLAALEEAMSEGGILQFQGGGEIVLNNVLKPRFNARLDANGHSVKISGGGTTRLVEVATNVTFSAVGIVFADGFHQGAAGSDGETATAGGNGFGGGILSFGGPVALTNCIITNCVVRGGVAGLDSSANLAGLSGGRAMGAAVYSMGGGLILQNCTIAGNSAFAGGNRSTNTAGAVSKWDAMALGAGLFSETNEVRIVDSTFFNNQARGGEPMALASGGVARAGNAAGGAIALAAGNLILNNSKLLSNSVAAATTAMAAGSGHAYGGGLFGETNVTLSVEKSQLSGNVARAGKFGQTGEAAAAEGGAIYNAGGLTLRDSTLEFNGAYGGATSPAGNSRGGAVASVGAMVVNTSTFNDNVAQGGQYETAPGTVAGGDGIGGAIFMASTLNVTNSTFASNRARGGSGSDANAPRGNGRGGAIAASVGPTVIANVTLAYNEASEGVAGAAATGGGFGGALLNFGGLLTLRSSIIASNAPANFSGSLTDNGYNISSDASFNLINSGSLTNKDALISILTTNGGPTKTIAIFPESPAREAIRGAFPSLDQRGALRPQGSFADSGAYEYVQTLPLFSVQPSGTNIVRLGTNITYQAQASGPGPIGYYWLKDSLQITGAVSTSLTITNIQPDDDGRYAVVATNSFGAATSTVARLIVDLKPVILTQPSNTFISPGISTSLIVNAIGPFLNYTWLRNETAITGANANELVINGIPGAEGAYKVIITNPSGSTTSLVANVTWSASALAILTHPQSQTVGIGDPVTLSALASGVAPIGYQWYKESLPIPGETGPTLSFAAVVRTNQGNYRVVVNNQFQTLTSSNATLSVVLPPLLEITRPSGSAVTITVTGDPAHVHRLQTSTNIGPTAVWTSIGSHTLPGSGRASWSVPMTTNEGPYFYRVVTP